MGRPRTTPTKALTIRVSLPVAGRIEEQAKAAGLNRNKYLARLIEKGLALAPVVEHVPELDPYATAHSMPAPVALVTDFTPTVEEVEIQEEPIVLHTIEPEKHYHRLKKIGSKWRNGTDVGIWQCELCSMMREGR